MAVTTEIVPAIEAIPSDRLWFDPQLINAACSIRLSTVQLAVNTEVLVAPAAVARLMVGFLIQSPFNSFQFSPWTGVNTFPFGTISNMGVSILWYKLFDYGPLVSSAWYCFPAALASVRVIEIIRV